MGEIYLEHVIARLPELEWKLTALGSSLNNRVLPQGLFKNRVELTAKDCINDIRADIDKLKSRDEGTSSTLLALMIERKVNVLVRLCYLYSKKKTKSIEARFDIDGMKTRQSFLRSLEDDISCLSKQLEALTLRLKLYESRGDVDVSLKFRADIGKLEQLLTRAQEKYAKAIS